MSDKKSENLNNNLKAMGIAVKALNRVQKMDLGDLPEDLKEDAEETRKIVDDLLRRLRGLRGDVVSRKHSILDNGGRFSKSASSVRDIADNLLMVDWRK